MFTKLESDAFDVNKSSEELNGCFYDFNNDGWLDLYVCNGGGGDFEAGQTTLNDRVYINEKGKFRNDSLLISRSNNSSTKTQKLIIK